MAERNDKSKSRSTPNRQAAKPRRASPSSEALTDAIEQERLRLMKAHSVLACVSAAMDVDDDTGEGPYYPPLIEMAGDLVDESIRRLDSVNLRAAASRLQADGEEEGYPAAKPPESFEVREPPAEYVVALSGAEPEEIPVPEVTTH